VSPSGSDSNIGSIDAPMKSVNAALKRLRELRADIAGDNKSGISGIYLRGGVYHLNIVVEKSDSGTEDAPLFIRSWKNEKVVISGGKVFSREDFHAVIQPAVAARLKPGVRGKVYELDVADHMNQFKPWPDRFKGYAGWPEVYINGEALHLARWPNKGYAKISEVIDKGSVPRYGDKSKRGGTFKYTEDEPSGWAADEDVYLNGYWCFKWADEVLKVAEIDPQKKSVKLAVPHTYGIGGASGGLYYAINLIEELDRDDEYVFDRKRGKIYMFLPEEIGGKAVKDVHVALGHTPLLKINNVSNVCLNGIVFADNLADGAVIKNSRNVVIENCTFRNISSTAVSISGCKKCGVRNSHIFNIGKAGINLSGGDRKTLTEANNYAVDNHIHNYARLVKTYAPAVRLSGVGQLAAHNYIHDAPHNAVLFGGNLHLIDGNRIERVCLDTADAGAIYCGRDWALSGNRIIRNWIADLGAAEHHDNWGIYLDDVASGITVNGNIMVDCPSGMLVGGGRNNNITGNLFVRCKTRAYLHYDCRGTKGKRLIPPKSREPKSQNVMWKKLRRIPCQKEPWKSRFSYLAALDNDDNPGAPKNAVVKENLAYNCAPAYISDLAKEFGTVEDNTLLDDDLKIRLVNGHAEFESDDPRLKPFGSFRIGPAD
jgi:hypothetical protein